MYAIESIIDFCINETTGVPEVFMDWKGFEEDDRTWEPLRIIEEDAPAIVKQFFRANPESGIGKHMLCQKTGGGRYGTCP